MSSSRSTAVVAGTAAPAALTRYSRQSNEDYATYVSRIEKTTSIVEGPHFPNIQAIHKLKEELDQHELRSRPGRLGTAFHLQRIDDKSAATY